MNDDYRQKYELLAKDRHSGIAQSSMVTRQFAVPVDAGLKTLIDDLPFLPSGFEVIGSDGRILSTGKNDPIIFASKDGKSTFKADVKDFAALGNDKYGFVSLIEVTTVGLCSEMMRAQFWR